ncbi:glycosyltransferase [Kitasatospora cheerisanensis]|uniref:glycosyltransferase n=1 Tax=Kitasatospora cheerisanensis TaxID=81942 RepID=UPI00068C1088|nr:glycosyltransferase [Kitasatospora cheerisanensis]
MRNPYDYRNPVRDDAVFAGRGEELAVLGYELDQACVDRPSVCVVLHGPRAAGKTSLLNATERLAAARKFTTVRVELNDTDREPADFFRKLYEEIVAVVAAEAAEAAEAAGTAPVGTAAVRRVMAGAAGAEAVAPLEFPEAVALTGPGGRVPEAALRADLAHFVGLLGHPIVLLVDEAQVIAEDARVLSILRFLTSRVHGLVLVLAGTSGLIEQITEVHSPILRQFREIEVRRFVEWEDIQNCMLLPLRSVGLHSHTSGDVVAALTHLTDGNPYEIQLYCHEMFAQWQHGITDGMELSPKVIEGIRSRMESGRRDVLDRPLIRAVRSLERTDLIAFNVLSSALDHATADDAWFAYCMTGPPEITRADFDRTRKTLIADGVLANQEILGFAIETELFDEIYARLWTASTLGSASGTPFTSRNPVHALMVDRLHHLLKGFAGGPLRVFPTCCPGMAARHLDQVFDALRTLPDGGPDASPRIELLHHAVLQAGEPANLDLTTVTCTFGSHRVERWLYSADTDDIVLADRPDFRAAAEQIAALGGRLTAHRSRIPLETWPADDWFDKATGPTRALLGESRLDASYSAYDAGDLRAALTHLKSSFDLTPGWEQANNLTYISLVAGLAGDARGWAGHAVELASSPQERSLSHYNAAMAELLDENRTVAAAQLARAAEVLETRGLTTYFVALLLMPDAADPATLREETGANLVAAVRRALDLLDAVGTAPAVGAEKPPVGRAPVILSVATEWSSSRGGLSTLNRDLCRALVAAGARVFCVVLDATTQESEDAERVGVTLLPAPRMPGASEDMRLASRPGLPDGVVPDLVLGHSRITGPAAKKLADDFFPAARRLHFVHMAPDEIEWYKPDRGSDAGLRAEERTDIERALGRSAHRVVAVGPWLHDQFLAEFTDSPGRQPLRLDPGFDVFTSPPSRVPPGGRPVRVLLLGRVEDARLKGLDLAAAACGRAARWMEEDGLRGVRLLVRGAPEAAAEEQRAQIMAWAGNPRLDVVVRGYAASRDRIDNDLNSASLLVMPSRAEGFGLVGVEAIAHGLPVLVGSESGLAQLLRETLGREQADRHIVAMSGDDEKDTDRWARAIDRKLRDCNRSFQLAEELRTGLAERVRWAEAATVILGEAAAR